MRSAEIIVKRNMEGSLAHINRAKSRKTTNARNCESGSVTEGCGNDQIVQNQDVDMEMIKEEMSITIADKDRPVHFPQP